MAEQWGRRWITIDTNLRQGFVYERVPHITLRDIANNAEIDVIWDTYRQTLEPLRAELNAALGESWQQRIAHRQEIDASIAANANFEYLYDKPYEDRSKVRVAGVPQAQKADKIDFTAVTG